MVAIVVLTAGFILLARGQKSSSETAANQSKSLTALEQHYDFGTISMAAGNVSHGYVVKNTSATAVKIDKMYTSCMCTVASLVKGEKRWGPVGMPGHDAVPEIGAELAPGEEALVEATFDPTAHGPAGVGAIDRAVVLETADGMTEMYFSANVVP